LLISTHFPYTTLFRSWCVMGINGAGKSTLLKLVAGATAPDDGKVTLGGSVRLGYFAQHAMDLLDGERTVFQWLEDSFPQAGQGRSEEHTSELQSRSDL